MVNDGHPDAASVTGSRDAIRTPADFGRAWAANDSQYYAVKNATLAQGRFGVRIVLSRDVAAGEEILIPYGFWHWLVLGAAQAEIPRLKALQMRFVTDLLNAPLEEQAQYRTAFRGVLQ